MTDQENAAARPNWEYRLVTRKTEEYLLDDLNRFGGEGWELVTITYHKDLKDIGQAMCWTAFLKRPAGEKPTTLTVEEKAAVDAARAAHFKSLTLDDSDTEFRFREESSQLSLGDELKLEEEPSVKLGDVFAPPSVPAPGEAEDVEELLDAEVVDLDDLKLEDK